LLAASHARFKIGTAEVIETFSFLTMLAAVPALTSVFHIRPTARKWQAIDFDGV
jgi:hypothetical protein